MVVYAICYLDMFGLKSIPTTPGSRAQRALIELHDFVNFKFTDDGKYLKYVHGYKSYLCLLQIFKL